MILNKIPKEAHVDARSYLERNRMLPDYGRLHKLIRGRVPLRWLFIGDSITHGCVHTGNLKCFREYFSSFVKRMDGRERDLFFTTAVSGAVTDDCMRYFNDWVEAPRSDIAFICFGMNDCYKKRVDQMAFRENLLRIVGYLREHNAIAILQTPQSTKGRDRALRPYLSVIRQVADAEKLMLIDVHDYWTLHKAQVRGMLSDAIHPNAYGHLQWTRLIAASLGFEDADAPLFQMTYRQLAPFKKERMRSEMKFLCDDDAVQAGLDEPRAVPWVFFGRERFLDDKNKPFLRNPVESFEEFVRCTFHNEGICSMMRFVTNASSESLNGADILTCYNEYISKYKPVHVVLEKDIGPGLETLDAKLTNDGIHVVKL